MRRLLRHITLISVLTLAISVSAQDPAPENNPVTEQTEETSSEEVTGDEVTGDEVIGDEVAAQPSLKSLRPTSTPVDYDREAPEQPVLHYYDKHGEPLETPVRFLAVLDTVTKIKAGPTYPTFDGVSVSANFFDAVMMIVGQQRASLDVAVDCSIHNWFFPTVEAGIGFAGAHPDDGRCHFKLRATPYVKVGIDYNFLYKSDPKYRFVVGLRAGWSSFGYDILAIQPGSEYYISNGPTNVTGLRQTSFYGQVLAGLRVRLWRGLFMGWSFRYGFNFHDSYSDPTYPAWFTPGYGTSPIAATFSIGWNFGQKSTDSPLLKEITHQ